MAYSPDPYIDDRPTGGDLVRVDEELRGIKGRITEEMEGTMPKVVPVQKVYPTGSSGINANASQTINLSEGTFQHYRVVQDTTFSFSVPSLEDGYVPFFTLRLTNGGNHNVSWPSGTRWPLGIPPVLSTEGPDMLVFYRPFPDSGFWEGILVASSMEAP